MFIVKQLYIFGFLHQTTTTSIADINRLKVVYLWFPTSNHNSVADSPHHVVLYIFGFLHQTTTGIISDNVANSCISLVSYIKPQPGVAPAVILAVVYLWFPTSNHNLLQFLIFSFALYIFGFLHQTTTNSERL